MGREVKRVAKNFNWPLKKTWEGFINPHYRKCEACDGCGETSAMTRLSELMRLVLLSGEDTVRKHGVVPHPYFSHCSGLHRTTGKVVSPDMLELASGLAGREISFMGFDSSAAWAATRKVIAAAGLPETWGTCSVCGGEGQDPACKEAYDAWTPTPPPDGDGWQMWETTSEGSPISPVCDTPEQLARWLASAGASAFGSDTATYEQWLAMIGEGWAMSAVIIDGTMMSGVAAAVEFQNKPE